MGKPELPHRTLREGQVKSQLREHLAGRSTLRKVERLVAKGWKPGLRVADVLGRKRRHAAGGAK